VDCAVVVLPPKRRMVMMACFSVAMNDCWRRWYGRLTKIRVSPEAYLRRNVHVVDSSILLERHHCT
jgi:hypothetical protein